jgi:uncharacterized membrane protein
MARFDRIAFGAMAVLAIVPIVSCGSGDRPLGVVDPDAAPATPTYQQVKAILDRRCLACHGGGSGGDRAGAIARAGVAIPAAGAPIAGAAAGATAQEDDRNYADCAGISADLDGILNAAVVTGSMPPGALPRLTEREKLIVERWILQGACSPCRPCP